MGFTLLVLTSFYPASRRAMHYADALASAQGGRLVLLHANRAGLYDPYVFAGEGWRREELEQTSDAGMLLAQLAGQLHAPATVELATDLLPQLLADLAQRHAPALYMLGLPKAAPHPSAQLSQAALELLRAAHVPVLLVPEAAEVPAPPQRVLVAADRDAFALTRAGQPVAAWLRNFGAELTVAYVSAVEDDAGCARALRAVQGSGLVSPDTPVDLRGYLHDDPAAGLLAALQEVGADLAVLLARERSYLGEVFHRSVTAQLVRRSAVPVLILPATEPAAAAGRRRAAGQVAEEGLLWPEA